MARRFAARCSAFALTAATVCVLPTAPAVWIAKPHTRTNQSPMIAAQASRIVASQNAFTRCAAANDPAGRGILVFKTYPTL